MNTFVMLTFLYSMGGTNPTFVRCSAISKVEQKLGHTLITASLHGVNSTESIQVKESAQEIITVCSK